MSFEHFSGSRVSNTTNGCVTRYARKIFLQKPPGSRTRVHAIVPRSQGHSSMNRHVLPSDVPFRDPISPVGRSVVTRRSTMRWREGQDMSFVHHKSSWVVRRQSDGRQFACPAIRIRSQHSSHAHRLGLDTGSPCRRQTAHRLCVGCKRNGRLPGRPARMVGRNQFRGR